MARTILLVDDDPVVHDVVGTLLRAQGYEIHSAMDGAGGIKKLQEMMPDLIILDFQMPGMGGGNVFEVLRGKGLTEDIPIIFMSSLPYSKQVEQVPISRNVRFVRKPVKPDELIAVVREFAGSAPPP